MKATQHKLPNGLRVITVPMASSPTVTVMVACETGSNYELKTENGLSHFLEHMVFKGTPTRPSALSVSLELDRVGAESNAFTSNEMTAYYAKGEKRHWAKLLDVVSDIYLNPNFPAEELERERGVILQEISMYEDQPQRKVWDVLTALLYGDTSAGRTILGPAQNIKKFSREDFFAYRKKHYVAKSTILVVAGDVDESQVLKQAKNIFKTVSRGEKTSKAKVRNTQTKPALAIKKKKSDQTHMIMAFRAPSARDKKATAVGVLMSVLGSGMSSRLFQKLREEMGACYYVRSANDLYTDHGFAAISTGIDKNRIVEIIEALIEECSKLKATLVSNEELQKTKDFIVSHLSMGLETSDGVAGFALDGEITHGKLKTFSEIEKEIRSITAEEIRTQARKLFVNKNLNLAVVGDISEDKKIRQVLTF
jgi:predicted Zn-dependent peptidase